MTGKTSLRPSLFLSVLFVLTFFIANTTHSDDVVPLNLGSQSPAERLAEVTSFFSVSSALPGKTYPAAVLVTIEKDWHINSARPYQDWLIPAELSYDTVPGLIPQGIVYPNGFDAFLADQKMSVYHDEVMFGFEIKVDDNLAPGEYLLPVSFTYQPCNDKECRPPETGQADLVIRVGEEGGPLNEALFARLAGPVEPDETAAGAATADSDLQRLINRYGFWGYFLALGLAFVTGLLLSFSPCTYPMIPITVSIFAGQKRSVGRGFVLSLFYVGSMAIVYGIMGMVVSLVGGVFGAWLASTPVVIGITVIFVIFALSMFGLYELQVPNSLRQKMGTVSSGGGVFGAVILGIVAALVVSPCVGPFVAGILLYIATHGSPVLGFLVLFVFALGLGTLYIILGTFSTAINALPGSGEWMESVKKFFGFVLLLMALYFLETIISPTLTAVLAGLILLALGVFGGGLDRLTPESKFFPRLKKFVGILALLLGLYFMAGTLVTQGLFLPSVRDWIMSPGGISNQVEESLIDWDTDLEAGLARARRENRPVLIDTWATWCVNCRVLDKKTFGNPEVAAEATRFVPLKIQLEKAGSPQTKAFMDRFGLKHYSLPTTLLLDSSGNVRRVLQGVVGPEEMLEEMRKI